MHLRKACPLCYHCAKNFHNRLKFDKVLTKNKFAVFLRHGVGTTVSPYRNIMQIVWLVIPRVGPGYRGAGPWPGVGVPQQRRASVAAVAVARP